MQDDYCFVAHDLKNNNVLVNFAGKNRDIELDKTHPTQLVSWYPEKRRRQFTMGKIFPTPDFSAHALVFRYHDWPHLVVHFFAHTHYAAYDAADMGASMGFGSRCTAR